MREPGCISKEGSKREFSFEIADLRVWKNWCIGICSDQFIFILSCICNRRQKVCWNPLVWLIVDVNFLPPLPWDDSTKKLITRTSCTIFPQFSCPFFPQSASIWNGRCNEFQTFVEWFTREHQSFFCYFVTNFQNFAELRNFLPKFVSFWYSFKF